MINFGFTLASALGLFNMILAPIYSIYMQKMITRRMNKVFYVFQIALLPLMLFVYGFILFFRGWRLDPILSVAFFLLNSFVIYICIKDFIIFKRISKISGSVTTRDSMEESNLPLYIFQAIIAFPILLLSAPILLFQGWRLDLLLRVALLLLIAIIFYLVIKDFFIFE